eukprot:Skav232318  [mRNA]  locus=scaffold2697:261691:262042:+ [translate_table: standard]
MSQTPSRISSFDAYPEAKWPRGCDLHLLRSKLTLDQVDILFRSHGDLCVDVTSWLACHVKISNVLEDSIHLHQEPHRHHVARVLWGLHLECSHLISVGVGERQQLRLIHCAP